MIHVFSWNEDHSNGSFILTAIISEQTNKHSKRMESTFNSNSIFSTQLSKLIWALHTQFPTQKSDSFVNKTWDKFINFSNTQAYTICLKNKAQQTFLLIRISDAIAIRYSHGKRVHWFEWLLDKYCGTVSVRSKSMQMYAMCTHVVRSNSV